MGNPANEFHDGSEYDDGEDPHEIDLIVDAVAVVSGDVSPEDIPLDRLTMDLAQRIWPYEDLARRYGLSMLQLVELCRNPAIAKMVKTKRAVWESSGSKSDQIKAYWAVGMAEDAPRALQMLSDPNVSPAIKVELIKIGMKAAGVDTGRGEGHGGGQIGGQFAINITLPGGHISSITPVVVEHEAQVMVP